MEENKEIENEEVETKDKTEEENKIKEDKDPKDKKDKNTEENSKSLKRLLFEYARIIVCTLIATFLVLQIIQISRVYGASMENTYHEGNVVIVDKTFYHTPKHNDIVICDYSSSQDETYIIKRVIGVGGDLIEIKENKVYRNGKELKEKYIKEKMTTNETLSVKVPKGQIFVMGDNRNNSLDSRRLGCFNFKKEVIGRVVLKVPFF